ncbi:sialate O-acetylesterase [Sphingomonas sp.]|uniref:sialate O-acetylesterase n=1 Tax=Sphingomonas sp. TaxID=28214 RepID=UPI0025FFA0B4|nr:sialate O-acetylesterase [Sphingomonas sp.]MBV9528456.1 9-O-acetylesterase [Sphingomonas sp.]
MPARPALILTVLLASSAMAAPTIDPQFSTHAVIQRGKPVLLSGTTEPGGVVMVTFADQTQAAKADGKGRWQAEFPARDAGQNLRLSVSGADGSASSTDLAFGDVWLCSGQSNMEYPLRRALNGDGEVASAKDDDLRLMKVHTQLSDDPRTGFATAPTWQRSTPDSARDFSATCTFMVRDFRATEKVPIGAIDDTWGGTPIRAWMSEGAARTSGNAAPAALLDLYRTDPAAAIARFGAEWGGWWRSKTGQKPGDEPWNASDRLAWKPVPSIGSWNDWGGDWPTFDGSVWARRRFTLTAAQASQPATLSLGIIDDMDETFVNGVAVGGSSDPSSPRNYRIEPGVLHSGSNVIVTFVRDLWGPGGLMGPASAMQIAFAGGRTQALGSGWQYDRIPDEIGMPPVPPWGNNSGVATIYNAMIAPLGALQIKGVAWYQGEADVGQPGYDQRLAAMMSNWRSQFRDPQLPFLIVGLAGWGKRTTAPIESGWASLINEQRLAVDRDPRAALASAIDLGEPNEIHPANKQEVGRRLALAGRSLAYPGTNGTLGPRPLRAVRQGNDVVVTFTKPLQTLTGASANAVELCGAAQGSCRYAAAQAKGASLVVTGDGRPVARVRYAWSDFPLVNLYDADLLPAPVFELTVQ